MRERGGTGSGAGETSAMMVQEVERQQGAAKNDLMLLLPQASQNAR